MYKHKETGRINKNLWWEWEMKGQDEYFTVYFIFLFELCECIAY